MPPVTTRFAQRASLLLREGKAGEALALCVEGTKHFPWYAAGYLFLGRSYEALGRDAEALLEYRKTWQLLPDNGVVTDQLNHAAKREEDAFTAFAAERGISSVPPETAITLSAFLSGAETAKENTVEFLAMQLQGAKRIVPRSEPPAARESEAEDDVTAPKIVTPTLAEIYASQGEFSEAAAAYRRLARERPADAEQFLHRATELEALARAPQ